MEHHTKTKGDLAVVLVIADLVKKDYGILLPISEHLPFDLIAYKDGVSLRIQCKYSKNNTAAKGTSWADKHGNHTRKYNDNDFDYYAVYLPDVDKIVYPSIRFMGCSFATTVPSAATPFYWYEDFLDFTDEAKKKTYKDFGFTLTKLRQDNGVDYTHESFIKRRKIVRPTKEELHKMLWEKPAAQLAKELGVSDKAIEKWSKQYKIEKPPRGYWAKKKYGKL